MLLSLLPFYPLLSFLLLITLKQHLSWVQASILSVGAMLICAISSLLLLNAISAAPDGVITAHLWHWFSLNVK